ncbi:GRAM domain-containing protein 2B [Electrophorus electricus]|uniref:GRAM domain-containing protein 2B n=1 Tax=Electrophorus electricus TaxID=8005 RepID=UPI0015D00AF9|nr:GRAM domain-containing protein 2B [Electrophorus electricus]
MENPLTCDDSVLKNCFNSDRPTCSVSPSQQTVLEPPCHEAENGGEERSRKTTQSDAPLAMDTESDILGRRRKPTLIRSRTFDPSILSQLQSDTESKIERKKLRSCQFLRTNNQYHKVFKDINENEQLKQSYTCALQKDILYQGRLFVSDNWICFHSKVFGKDTKIVIPVTSVKVIQKTKTAILVPNALVITTAQEKYVFVSLLSRDTTYKVLMSVCFHLEDKCLGNSSIPTSAHRNYRVIPSALPLDFTADLSNLDGPVSHRRQVIGDSSSSDSPDLPEYEKLSEYPKHSQVFKNVVKQDSVSVTYPQQAKHEQCAYDVKAMRQYSFNGLLMVYLILVFILVLSSCYMALKIISLEQRLTSLRSMTELSLSGFRDDHHSLHPEDNAEIYSVLSMNLVKLEKIQRNLQRLLKKT